MNGGDRGLQHTQVTTDSRIENLKSFLAGIRNDHKNFLGFIFGYSAIYTGINDYLTSPDIGTKSFEDIVSWLRSQSWFSNSQEVKDNLAAFLEEIDCYNYVTGDSIIAQQTLTESDEDFFKKDGKFLLTEKKEGSKTRASHILDLSGKEFCDINFAVLCQFIKGKCSEPNTNINSIKIILPPKLDKQQLIAAVKILRKLPESVLLDWNKQEAVTGRISMAMDKAFYNNEVRRIQKKIEALQVLGQGAGAEEIKNGLQQALKHNVAEIHFLEVQRKYYTAQVDSSIKNVVQDKMAKIREDFIKDKSFISREASDNLCDLNALLSTKQFKDKLRDIKAQLMTKRSIFHLFNKYDAVEEAIALIDTELKKDFITYNKKSSLWNAVQRVGDHLDLNGFSTELADFNRWWLKFGAEVTEPPTDCAVAAAAAVYIYEDELEVPEVLKGKLYEVIRDYYMRPEHSAEARKLYHDFMKMHHGEAFRTKYNQSSNEICKAKWRDVVVEEISHSAEFIYRYPEDKVLLKGTKYDDASRILNGNDALSDVLVPCDFFDDVDTGCASGRDAKDFKEWSAKSEQTFVQLLRKQFDLDFELPEIEKSDSLFNRIFSRIKEKVGDENYSACIRKLNPDLPKTDSAAIVDNEQRAQARAIEDKALEEHARAKMVTGAFFQPWFNYQQSMTSCLQRGRNNIRFAAETTARYVADSTKDAAERLRPFIKDSDEQCKHFKQFYQKNFDVDVNFPLQYYDNTVSYVEYKQYFPAEQTLNPPVASPKSSTWSWSSIGSSILNGLRWLTGHAPVATNEDQPEFRQSNESELNGAPITRSGEYEKIVDAKDGLLDERRKSSNLVVAKMGVAGTVPNAKSGDFDDEQKTTPAGSLRKGGNKFSFVAITEAANLSGSDSGSEDGTRRRRYSCSAANTFVKVVEESEMNTRHSIQLLGSRN